MLFSLCIFRIGRKMATIIFLALKMVGVFMSTFAPVYVVFIIGRFILGMGSIAVYMTSYVLS